MFVGFLHVLCGVHWWLYYKFHSTFDRHSSGFQAYVLVNGAVMTVLVDVFGGIYACSFVGQIPRSGVIGARNMHIFLFSKVPPGVCKSSAALQPYPSLFFIWYCCCIFMVLISIFLIPWWVVKLTFLGWGHMACSGLMWGSQFPVQGLNLGHGGKSAESQPLDHQETPSVTMYDFSLTWSNIQSIEN